jgi:hypothetical protein
LCWCYISYYVDVALKLNKLRVIIIFCVLRDLKLLRFVKRRHVPYVVCDLLVVSTNMSTPNFDGVLCFMGMNAFVRMLF